MTNPFEIALLHALDASTELHQLFTDHAKRWKRKPRFHPSTNIFRQCAALAAPALVGRLSLRQEITTLITHFDAEERENDRCRTVTVET
jgi:hypothetical protein